MHKFAKVKLYFLLIFERKELNSFLTDQKLPKFYNKNFSNIFFNKKMYKFWHLMTKNLKGWSHKLETLHKETLGTVIKKSREKKYGGSPSLGILHL